MIIAIDGPAASGKSTVAKAVARRLAIHYLDTGAMYRAVTWLALERGVPVTDEPALAALAAANDVEFEYAAHAVLPTAVRIAGTDVTAAIRTPRVDAAVSAVSRVPELRSVLVGRQRELASAADAVVEGRDIGTVVFPDAAVKVFLTASSAERAHRRSRQLADTGHTVAVDEVREGLVRRDEADSSRDAGPLDRASDAHLLDTTGLTVNEVVDRIVALWEDSDEHTVR